MHQAFLWTRVGLLTAALGWLSVSVQAAERPGDQPVAGGPHWAFRAVKAAAVPRGAQGSAKSNPVDAFIASALEAKGLTLSKEADRATLLRRVYLDLIGVPPTREQTTSFVADTGPGAYERVVEGLLASPKYGERWARHWLDLARYAESEGFKADETRPNAWRYRDYVIRSFNADKPYDRFLQEQIAGDELWPEDTEALIATGFNRHYPDESNARNLMQRRQEILNDITDTVGSVFMGLTMACARCHNHKTDPISQAEYYRLQAFFANTAAVDDVPLMTQEARARYREKHAIWETKTAAIRAEREALEAPARAAIIADYVEKYPEPIQVALKKSESERTPFECQMVAKARLYIDPSSHQYLAPSKAAGAKLKGTERKRWEALNAELERFSAWHPGSMPLATGVMDLGTNAPSTYTLKRGNWEAPETEVAPGLPVVLGVREGGLTRIGKPNSTGRRATLARMLVDPSNPLTARVMVNRLWHHHFGRGLVGTPSDFGVKGEAPSHPELLDWLASAFVSSGWSLKTMHRWMVTSETYRQDSSLRAEASALDPDNRYLWRFPRSRLEGEAIRDSMLHVAGLLNERMEGPSVFPELPPGMETRGGWKASAAREERDRRSIYVFVRRNTRFPMFETFDMPDTHETCARRNQTTSPLQALTLLNSQETVQWASAFARRMELEVGSDVRGQVDQAYRAAFGRAPTSAELEGALRFVREQADRMQQDIREGAEGGTLDPVAARKAAMADLCHALMNSNEFVYRF